MTGVIDTSTFADAVHLLAEAQLLGAGTAVADEVGAVHRLGAAPAEDLWNRGLLIGLHSRRPEVVEATVRSAVDRLARLTDHEAQDDFLGAILDACFLHLPGGRPRSKDDGDATRQSIEQAAAKLIAAVGRLLADGSPDLEHHRARLLARARQIKHHQGWGFLAEAVVALQHGLTTGQRSDALVAKELAKLRKLSLYASPDSAEPALLAYLEADRELPLEQTSQELWQAYRLLLAVHTKERAGRALLRAMDNLIRWLDATPQTAHAREAVLGEVVQMARLSVPRDRLEPRIGRHLEAHLELLPGPEHPQDLLVQLRTRYDAAAGEEFLVKGLELLRRLPLVRLRSLELCEFVLASARRQRSGRAWHALLTLVESIVTGIADLVITRETLDAREQRRLRLLRDLLAHDARLRELLYRLATDQTLDLSHDRQVDAQARDQAWRILLRCLPPDRIERQREGLLGHDGRFFFATLEEAGGGHRRELWEALLEHWDRLVGAAWPADERRRRLRAVTGFFRQTRDYLALREESGGLGPLLELAFDDADVEVRKMAEAALVETGYGLEVERERERRRLLALGDMLSANNQQIITCEQEIARLGHDAVATQVLRAEQALTIQDLLVTREGAITDGWMFTADLQVDLEEIRIALMEALARAEEQMILLRELQREMQKEHREADQLHGRVQTMVREQEQYEQRLRDLQHQLAQARSGLSGANSALHDYQRQIASEQGNTPRRPSRTGDPERDQAQAAAYREAVARHRSTLQSLRSSADQAAADIRSAEQQIRSCTSGIGQTERTLATLQTQINGLRARLRALRGRIDNLARRFEGQQATLAALRQRIRQLEGLSRDVHARQQSHAGQMASSIAANTRQIQASQAQLGGIQQRLHTLSAALNDAGHRRDLGQTRSQELIQAIDSGRDEYDRVAQRAIPESRQADVTGHSQRDAHQREATDNQEALVQYAEGIHHAIVRDKPLEVRLRRRRSTSGAAREEDKTRGGRR